MTPRLRRGVRVEFDSTRLTDVILRPEGVLIPNTTAAATLRLCDGERTVDDIVTALRQRFRQVDAVEVSTLLEKLVERRIIEWRLPPHHHWGCLPNSLTAVPCIAATAPIRWN